MKSIKSFFKHPSNVVDISCNNNNDSHQPSDSRIDYLDDTNHEPSHSKNSEITTNIDGDFGDAEIYIQDQEDALDVGDDPSKWQVNDPKILSFILMNKVVQLLKCFFQRRHQQKNIYLHSPPNGPSRFEFPMANCGRAFKAILLAGIVIILLNLYNYRPESKTSPSMSSAYGGFSQQWPKRTRTSFAISHLSHGSSTKNVSYSTNVTNTPQQNVNVTFYTTNTSNSNDEINEKNKVILESDISLVKLNSSKSNESLEMSAISSKSSGENLDNIESSTKSVMLQKIMSTLGPNYCPPIPPDLVGSIEVNTTLEDIKTIESRFVRKLLPGGWYKPKECISKDRVAIIIPYRDRAQHLPIFLANIHPFLMKQQIEYGIFLIEQVTEGLFNRAALMNVGFVESQKLGEWDCFIFHDIDLIPMDDRNLYNCPDQPRHMSVAVDTMGFKLPYSSIFGGVSAMTKKQFQKVNGFSNCFWGWGGEDDDMSNRLKHVGYHIARYPINIARYTMLNHRKEKANPKRYEKLVNGAKKYDVEGLNSLEYKIHYLEKKVLYTWVLVEIKQDTGS
ncbi:Beta-1,4-N-acetylgalactosaminyltransferase bre-4 [Pseudolycoriella hygida]|uniref:Beta-1,4-N-acetylgalactosaminyltransferase bre-4 n=1 Tax=Pseudolycoriella hygida TaxID=35572 RepID=A0A9Q0NE76_9DIPT|nr:Beta-1,4-N-acetylgalactosaminyltransferase bre-4 [Pseudolycoriella hygida]